MATETKTPAVDEILEGWRAEGIAFVRFELPDMHGTSRSKLIPIERASSYAQEGLNMYGGAGVLDTRSDVVPGTLYNEEVAYGDQRLIPDPHTAAAIPWVDGTARFICDSVWDDGRPLAALPRHVFRRILDRCHALGYEAMLGSEPEFYLLDPETNGLLFEGYHIFNTVRNTYVPFVKELAHLRGYLATFMSKPFTDSAGSGCHTHVSLLDFESGENLFGEEDAEAGISELCRQFIAGQLRHARSIYALLAPTPNCLKRRRTHTFSPTNISWGFEDRSALVRIKGGSVKSRHVENRGSTGLSNPYLACAAVLGAGLLGIQERLELEPLAQAPAEEDESKEKLPTTVEESLAHLEADEKMVELLGTEFVQAYTVMRRHELQRFADHVTDWERSEYLELF